MSLADKRPESVLIIGAGISGLSCARYLKSQGVDTSVFEKSGYAGGRLSTRVFEQWQCDHGAQYFTARDPRFKHEVEQWQREGVANLWRPRLGVFEGVPLKWRPAHSAGPERYVGVPTMRALAQHFAKNQTIQLNTTVDKLQRSQLGWQVHSQEYGWTERVFDALVLALPAPQSLALLQTNPSTLNAKLATFTMRPTWALMLRLEEGFDPGFDAAFVNGGPLRWMAKNTSKPDRQQDNVWLLHASAQWSEEHIEDSRDEVSAALQEEFNKLTGGLALQECLHLWRYADTEYPADSMYLWDGDLTLGVCGDWLSEGKVEGAWKSGLELASTIAQGSNERKRDIVFSKIEIGTNAYQCALALRESVLREPLGRALDADDLEGESEQWHFVLFDKRGEVAATLSVRVTGKKHCKFRQMAVLDAYRGQGLGGMILAKVEQVMHKKGFETIELHARVSAQGFYKKNGYTAFGDVFDEVGIAHIRMKKELI